MGKKLKISDIVKVYIITALLGIAAFLVIYGPRIINPFYVDWFLGYGELNQHYLGWKAYKESGWMFPIGCTRLLMYPEKSSIIFTDSIPCMAVFFKLFKAVLPVDFQYFGIWGVLCFALQGVFSGKILYRASGSKTAAVMGSVFFILAPVMIGRMYGHTALAGQWVMLAAMDIVFEACMCFSNEQKKIVIKSAGLGFLAASVHIYFIPLCGIFLICGVLYELLKRQKSVKLIFMTAVYVLSAGCTVYLLGGFTTSSSVAETGELGQYSYNMLGILNPSGWSVFLKDISLYCDGQAEGFSYIGAGMLLLAFAVLAGSLSAENMKEKIEKYSCELVTCLVCIFLTLIIALSPTASAGTKVLYSFEPEGLIGKVWSIFRSTGRFSWILVYLIFFLVIVLGNRQFGKRLFGVMLSLSLLIQITDLHKILYQIHRKDCFRQNITYETFVDASVFWKETGDNEEIEHIMLAPNARFFSEDKGIPIINWALFNGKTLNSFYFSHDASFGIVADVLRKSMELKKKDTLYIFPYEDILSEYYPDIDMNLYYAGDDVIVGYYGKLEGLERCYQ